MERELAQEILGQLKLSNKLLAYSLMKEAETQTDKILLLAQMGFNNSDIANFVGSTSDSVRGTRNRLRREGRLDDQSE